MAGKLTSRGYKAPSNMPEKAQHQYEGFYIVRLTMWEFHQLRCFASHDGRAGVFCLLPSNDGTFELIRSELNG